MSEQARHIHTSRKIIGKRFQAFIKVIRFYSASTRSSYRPVSLFLGAHQYNLTTGLTLIILFRIFIERFEIKCSLTLH